MKEEHRIKIAAAEWAYDKVDVSAYQGYIAGATAELERAHHNTDWMKLLKQERNKAIDECIAKVNDVLIGHQYVDIELEKLKH